MFTLGVLAIVVFSGVTIAAGVAPTSDWVGPGADGRLVYKSLDTGDRIMDFSHAGYMGGGVALPDVPVKRTVRPDGSDDDSPAIQAAIDAVSKLEPINGFRGAVLLERGTFNTKATLTINSGGVVLRGSGSDPHNGTVLTMVGEPHVCIRIVGTPKVNTVGGPTTIDDEYVPSGATSFIVANAAGLAKDDWIQITKPVTPAWVEFMGMDKLVRSGKKQTWLSGEIHALRRVARVDGKRITLDVPLSDSYNAKYLKPPGVSVAKVEVAGQIERVGAENLRIISPAQSVTISEAQHQAIRVNGAWDAWLRDIAIQDTVNSVAVGTDSRRVTVQSVSITHTTATKGAAKPADFTGNGTQVLFDRCHVKGDNVFYFVTLSRVSGPVVVMNCTFEGGGWIQPHARWATGVLIDNCRVPGGGIDFMNRGIYGSGHGWTVGWAVAWNCSAKRFLVQQPPGAANWAIGCTGARESAKMPGAADGADDLPAGISDSHGTPVAPASLYLAQLRNRLGSNTLKYIGYDNVP